MIILDHPRHCAPRLHPLHLRRLQPFRMRASAVVFLAFTLLAFSTVLAGSLASLTLFPLSMVQVVHGMPLFVLCSVAYEPLQPPSIPPTKQTIVLSVYDDFRLPLCPALPLFHGQQLVGRIRHR